VKTEGDNDTQFLNFIS